MQCGACRPICPVHQATRREEHAPRAKLKLYQSLVSGRHKLNKHNLKPLQQCLLCGRCQKNCPSKVDVTDALKQGRAWLKQKGVARLLARLLVSSRLARLMQCAWPVKKAFSQGFNLRLRPLKRLPSLRMQPPAHPLKGTPTIGLFVGCMATYARPGLAEKAIAVLEQVGPVVLLNGCCGLAGQSAGDDNSLEQAKINLQQQLDPLKLDYIVTICTSCAHALIHEHAPANANMPPIMDISRFMAQHPQLITHKRSAAKVYLHLSCHLENAAELQAWLQASGVEFEIIDACCGGGGLLPLTNPLLSQRITPPVADLPVIVTCSGCYLQWLQSPAKTVLHPLEL